MRCILIVLPPLCSETVRFDPISTPNGPQFDPKRPKTHPAATEHCVLPLIIGVPFATLQPNAHLCNETRTRLQRNVHFCKSDTTLQPNGRFSHFGVLWGSRGAPQNHKAHKKSENVVTNHVFYDAKRRWPSPLSCGIAFFGRDEPKVAIPHESGEGEVTNHCIFTRRIAPRRPKTAQKGVPRP